MNSLRENATSVYVNVTCQDLISRVTGVKTSANTSAQTDDEWRHLLIKFVVDTCLAPCVCAFGILGNAVNLFVLTRKQMKCTLKHMERSYNEGLVALALSDLLFCFVYLVVSFADRKLVYSSRDFRLNVYLNTYQEPLLNIFLFSSTWLTVVMAIGRYIAICRPLHARRFISLRATRVTISLVFVAAFLANLPRFWRYYVMRKPCSEYYPRASYRTAEDCTCFIYIKAVGGFYKTIKFGYGIVLGTLTIFLPMAILVLCNLCLIRALRRSYAMQRMCCASQPKETGHRITPTLIALIVCFVTLVSPSEVLGFLGELIVQWGRRRGVSRLYGFQTAVTVCNCLLLVNFAVSVILYCVINVQFRRVMRAVFCCHALRRRRKRNALKMTSVKSYQNTITCHMSDMETEI